jgi:ZIP family zinc transporter
MEAVTSALELCLAPSVLMLVMSLLAFSIRVPPTVVSALQHLAAGIVLSAVSIELMPVLMEAESDPLTTISMTIGFGLGIALFLALGAFCGKGDEATANPESETDGHNAAAEPLFAAPVRHASVSRLSLMKSAQDHFEVRAQNAAPQFPVGLFVAVGTDALVDGLLIGIASTSGANAGKVMAVALAIEMGFLGLTFATTILSLRQPRVRVLASVLAPPLLLAAGGGLGGLTASLLASSPVLHVGLIAFGVAALLFLVTEELLLEAHSGGSEEHVWWVDMQFFLGFYLSILFQKYVGA